MPSVALNIDDDPPVVTAAIRVPGPGPGTRHVDRAGAIRLYWVNWLGSVMTISGFSW